MFAPGAYYIGDLCYVIPDHKKWVREFCNNIDGVSQISTGEPFAMFSTAYGDGNYRDNIGREYGVDSGTIGCIAVNALTKGEYIAFNKTLDLKLGHMEYFDKPFEVSNDGGILRFGNIVIDTLNEPEYDDEPEEEPEEEEELEEDLEKRYG